MAEHASQVKVDFKKLKSLVPITAVLERYGVKFRQNSNVQVSADCPLPSHTSKNSRGSFKVNVDANVWCCKSESCSSAYAEKLFGKKGGDVIDFVRLMEGCDIVNAAKKLLEWFPETGEPQGDGKVTAPKTETRPKSSTNGHKPTQPLGKLPEHMVKTLPFMQQIEIWFADLIKLRDNESNGQYEKRVLAGIKSKILESYRNGKTAAPAVK
ncbi:MAG TPA: hypothetical protein VGZ48_07360 [Candidatus Acidoferrales bacterium]|nr:hypothetical protein [Candidatus Acidoferrales bacterium]